MCSKLVLGLTVESRGRCYIIGLLTADHRGASAQMRVTRRLKIRTEAAQASLTIMMPIVGCVFPTLWLILLGPSLIVVMNISK